MSLIVQKYGGTSVADIERIRNVARKVVKTYDHGHNVVVILSAMAGVTDSLIDMAAQAASPPDKRELDVLLATGEQTTAACGTARQADETAHTSVQVNTTIRNSIASVPSSRDRLRHHHDRLVDGRGGCGPNQLGTTGGRCPDIVLDVAFDRRQADRIDSSA